MMVIHINFKCNDCRAHKYNVGGSKTTGYVVKKNYAKIGKWAPVMFNGQSSFMSGLVE